MSMLAKPLLGQWQAVYTKRAFRTGVSELLREFDGKFFGTLGGVRTYDEHALKNTLTKEQATDAYYKAHALEQKLKSTIDGGPKFGEWTSKEIAFFKQLRSDLSKALVFLSERKGR